MSDGHVCRKCVSHSLLAIIAVVALSVHRLFALVMLSGAFSLTAAAQFVVLDAVDVAFTEAAVGGHFDGSGTGNPVTGAARGKAACHRAASGHNAVATGIG